MIKFRLCVLFLFFNVINYSLSAQNNEKIGSLEIFGTALLNDKPTNNYSISVYLNGKKIDSLYTNKTKSIFFILEYNQLYTFLFQKKECLDKLVIINTELPKELKRLKNDTFEFEVEMTQDLVKNSKEIEDFPVAVLSVNKDQSALEASKSYNELTHSETEVTTIYIYNNSTKKVKKNK